MISRLVYVFCDLVRPVRSSCNSINGLAAVAYLQLQMVPPSYPSSTNCLSPAQRRWTGPRGPR